MRSNPFDEIEDVLDRIGRELEAGVPGGLTGGRVAVDLIDEGEIYHVVADLPGMDAADIELTIADGTLTIAAVRPTDDEARYLRRERPQGSLSRRVRLPEPVDEDAVSASYDAGVLRVEIPKRRADGSTRIDIE